MTLPRRVLVAFGSAWLIFAAALATRLAFAWDQQRKIPHQVLASVSFEQEAGNIAFALSQGDGFSDLFRQKTGPTAWLAPIYPWLLSLIFRVFGSFTISSFFAAVTLNAICSAGVVFPLFSFAHRVAGTTSAVIASWIWVFIPAGVILPFEWIWDTSLSVLLVTILLWMTIVVSESASPRRWIAYGFLWGAALLTNPSLAIALPFLLKWAAMRARRTVHISWSSPGAALLLAVLCCVPWTIRNYADFHRLIPLRSSLPFELWIGNNDIFDEHAAHGIQRITRFEEARRYEQMGENAYLSDKWIRATSFIRANPMLFLRLCGRRVIATWTGTEHPFHDLINADSLLAQSIIVCNLLLTVGTAAGIVVLFLRKGPYAVPLAVYPLLFPVLYYVTHTSLRYRHPIDPLLIFFTVYAVRGGVKGTD